MVAFCTLCEFVVHFRESSVMYQCTRFKSSCLLLTGVSILNVKEFLARLHIDKCIDYLTARVQMVQ